jgi:hypothetical protein
VHVQYAILKAWAEVKEGTKCIELQTEDGYEVKAYDMRNQVIRIDVKLKGGADGLF